MNNSLNFWENFSLVIILTGLFLGFFAKVPAYGKPSFLKRLISAKISKYLYVILTTVTFMYTLVRDSWHGIMEYCKRFITESDNQAWLMFVSLGAAVAGSFAFAGIVYLFWTLGSLIATGWAKLQYRFYGKALAFETEKVKANRRIVKSQKYAFCLHIDRAEILALLRKTEPGKAPTESDLNIWTITKKKAS